MESTPLAQLAETIKILLGIGGTVCAALATTVTVLWIKTEKLSSQLLETNRELGELRGEHSVVRQLHSEVIDVVREQVQTIRKWKKEYENY